MTSTDSSQRTAGYLVPFISMVVMMALIGLITSINQQFQAPIREAFLARAGTLKNTLATLLSFSFFLAYLVMGTVSAKYLDKKGYKQTIVMGLIILACGLAIFEVAALVFQYLPPMYLSLAAHAEVPVSYFIFLLGSFVCGTGLTYMQSSVNPYIVACDVKGTSGVQRQNISGTANSIMTTLGPLFITYVVFAGTQASDVSISSIYVPMLVLLLFVLFLAVAVPKLRLPHIAGTTSQNADSEPMQSVWRFRRVSLGVMALFVYVGVEVCVGANINLYATSDLGLTMKQAAMLASGYWLSMLIGRLLSSFMSRVQAQHLLAFATLAASLLIVLFFIANDQTFVWTVGSTQFVLSWRLLCLIATGLFHSVMWGAIFSLALEKLGKYTAKATGVLLMAVVGGAVLPVIQALLADLSGSWHYTWVLVLLGELFMLFYALWGSRIPSSEQIDVA